MHEYPLNCIADDTPSAQAALNELLKICPNIKNVKNAQNLEGSEFLIVLGGDGFMLHTMHRFMNTPIKFYGINTGLVGFLMNDTKDFNIEERIKKAEVTKIFPLAMHVECVDGTEVKFLAINEVSVVRQTILATHIRISIDDELRMQNLICDGVLVSTPAGSSAYNASAGGPILPINSHILALTPICPFRPRNWQGAILPSNAIIKLEVIDTERRSASAVADFNEVKNIKTVIISEQKQLSLNLLFDPNHSLSDRIIREQFMNNY